MSVCMWLRGYDIETGKVRTFWETHQIWKNLPRGFDKSADLLIKRQNHKEDFFQLCVLLKKYELYLEWLIRSYTKAILRFNIL